MITVRQVLKQKGMDFWSVPAGATIYQALELMAEKNIGAVLVFEDEQLAGIFSERDYARSAVLKSHVIQNMCVSEVMTRDVYSILPEATMEDCMLVFIDRRIRHLPVMEDDVIWGVISIGDVVSALISDQKMTIRELGKYISGV